MITSTYLGLRAMDSSMILTIILWILTGVATGYLAYRRGRDPYIWFALGIFFGILAILVLVLLPTTKVEEEIAVDRRNEEIVEGRERQLKEREKLENAPNLQPQSVEAKEWFYLDKTRQQQGPLSFYSLNVLWENGEINGQSYVWTEGMAEWKRIQEVEDLYHVLEQLEAENRKAFPEEL